MVGKWHTLTWEKGVGHNSDIRRCHSMAAGRRGMWKGEVALDLSGRQRFSSRPPAQICYMKKSSGGTAP